MSATYADHGRRLLVDFPYAAVRRLGFGRDWNEVAGLGVGLMALAALESRPQRQERLGATFCLFQGKEDDMEGINRVWWSDGLRMPWRIVSHGGRRILEVTSCTMGRKPLSSIPDLAALYPDYVRVDAADLEEYLEDQGESLRALQKKRDGK